MKSKKSTILLFMVAAALSAFAAGPKVTINSQGRTVASILDEIRRSTGYEVFYNDQHVDTDRRVTLQVTDEELSDVLEKLFRGTDTSFSIRGQQVILSQREEQAPSTPQQSRTVSGTVTDQLGEPLIGATVREQGTNNAVTTDFDGKFFLEVTSANPTLEIQYVGFKPFIEEVATGTPLEVVMQEDNNTLDELQIAVANANRNISRLELFPSAHIAYEAPHDQTISAGYAYRTNRPGIWQLEPYITYEDYYTKQIGNPDICPEYIHTDIHNSEDHRPADYSVPCDPFYATDSYWDYRKLFDKNITQVGMNPAFVGPRLFRAIEDNQMYIVPHMHTHASIRARHARIEADLERDEALNAEFEPLQKY